MREPFARGEIDQAEFLVRMRALHDGDDKSVTERRPGTRAPEQRRLQSPDPISNDPAAHARPAPGRHRRQHLTEPTT